MTAPDQAGRALPPTTARICDLDHSRVTKSVAITTRRLHPLTTLLAKDPAREDSKMLLRTTLGLSAFAAAIAVSFWPYAPAMSGESPPESEGSARYLPIQSISYTFGSKTVGGYFVQQNSVCRVVLMISERSDPEAPSPTAARVRIMLDPGQVAGLDSEEGRSLNFTCGEDAATLVVDYGERAKLLAQQRLAVTNTIAERVQR